MGENRTDPNSRNRKGNLDNGQRCEGDKNIHNQKTSVPVSKSASMGSLIIWNISKVLEENPSIDLKQAIKAAQGRLERDCCDMTAIISQHPEERHLACALLAWQQLGHKHAASLHQFYETKRIEQERISKVWTSRKETGPRSCGFNGDPKCPGSHKDLKYAKDTDSGSFASCSIGPVVRLPVHTRIVMRVENAPSTRPMPKRQTGPDKDIMDKIDAACCLESECVERLEALDTTTNELRTRASKLARREAERVELLERAEAAWKDLELGYQRRLTLAEEREDDLTKQTQKLIEERNEYKNACTTLAQKLRQKAEIAEKDRARLTQVEKEVCDRACLRLRLSEESARGDAALAEHQCRVAQLERDLQFKEEQARRKLLSLESEAESAGALTHDAERAMRAELGALREQIAQVSNQLLEEDAENGRIKQELEEMRMDKMAMVEDLDGCKAMCDSRMQGRIDELKMKRDQLKQLKEQVMECRCKLPVDADVQAKRTPSLAALCRCTPEDKILDSCSCTSLRSSLLSNLLSDLFGGLQAELGGLGSQMPCQLLKCLEDKHNWDRASIVKTNLRNFFSQLLVGELDIAIATSIEKYHAKWVGTSCADEARLAPDPGEVQNEGWQERALERRAQQLATKLAEQLFQERAEQLTQRAKEIVTTGPPPCECKPQPAVYSCLVKTSPAVSSGRVDAPADWRRTLQDVTQLKLQIEDLKKESIKKQDLQLLEENIAKILQFSSDFGLATETADKIKAINESSKKDNKSIRTTNTELHKCYVSHGKCNIAKKKHLDINVTQRKGYKHALNQNIEIDKPTKSYKKQAFAVNMCLCSTQKDSNKTTQQCKLLQNVINNDEKDSSSWKQKPSKNMDFQVSSIKHTKPINTQLPQSEINNLGNSKTSAQPSCLSDCICFHKMPSNTSIDKLLETLLKWKCDLTDSQYKAEQNNILCNNKTDNTSYKDSKNKTMDNYSITESKGSKINKIISNVSDDLNDNKMCSISCNAASKNDFKSPELENNMPPTTESEYMGAVNLDKSHENVCKCINNNDMNIEKPKHEKSDVSAKFAYKCIHSSECICKIILEPKTKEENPVITTNPLESQLQTQNDNNIEPLQDNVVSFSEKISDMPKNNQNADEENLAKLDINKTAELFPCDCDYRINFLGVTLVNTDTPMKIKESDKDCGPNKKESFLCNEYTKFSENRGNLKKQKNFNNSLDEKKCCDTYDNYESDNNSVCATENCHVKFNEINISAENQERDINISKNKTIDTLNLKENIVKKGSCICCNGTNVDESKDLEENAFHLLEQHFKEQLREFKTSSCKSSCIPSEEEEKIFTNIFQRVKQVISDSTKPMTCKCSGEQRTEGSWNRAYGLLQEYLKIKMKRVQCLCIPKQSKDSASPILDDVLDRVCNLIQNDFERLKSICKCKDTKQDQAFYTEEIPVKDTDNTTLYSFQNNKRLDTIDTIATCDNMEKLSKQNSNKSIILTENISSQVPPNLGMKTKSCGAIEKDTKNSQTIEIIPSTENHISSNTISDCNCCSSLPKKSYVSFLESGANEVLINHYTDLAKKEDINAIPLNAASSSLCICPVLDVQKNNTSLPDIHRNTETKEIIEKMVQSYNDKQIDSVVIPNYPYIGYTINCTCDAIFDTCVCMKSVIQGNNDKITKIWKTNTEKNNARGRNISYIMNGTPNVIITSSDINDHYNNVTELTEDLHPKNLPKTDTNQNRNACETEISVNYQEDMILKESRENCKVIHNTTNTFGEDASFGTNFSSTEDPIDWYDCGSQSQPLQNALHNDRYEDSIYFPASIDKYQENVKEVIVADIDTAKLSNTFSQNCNCNMVPICHVKMLMENIEDKLVHAKCTCDSLISKACPVHSSKMY